MKQRQDDVLREVFDTRRKAQPPSQPPALQAPNPRAGSGLSTGYQRSAAAPSPPRLSFSPRSEPAHLTSASAATVRAASPYFNFKAAGQPVATNPAVAAHNDDPSFTTPPTAASAAVRPTAKPNSLASSAAAVRLSIGGGNLHSTALDASLASKARQRGRVPGPPDPRAAAGRYQRPPRARPNAGPDASGAGQTAGSSNLVANHPFFSSAGLPTDAATPGSVAAGSAASAQYSQPKSRPPKGNSQWLPRGVQFSEPSERKRTDS